MSFFALAILFLTSACNTQKITTTWKTSSNNTEINYNKIMVLGLIIDTDRSIQENMENHLADDLKSLGYNATTSLKEFGPKAFNNMTEEAAIEKLKNNNIDAVVTIVLLDKQRERNYVPRDINNTPFGSYNTWFWGYQNTINRRIYSPGYFVIDTRYFWESNLFDMSNQKLIYSAQTQSFNPVDSQIMGHRYGKMIVRDMIKQNVLLRKVTQ